MKTIFSAIALVLAFSSSGIGRDPITTLELIDHLEGALTDCNSKTRNLTGAPKGKMLLHKKTMEDVLEDLKTRREVDLKKLGEALKVHAN